MINKVDIQLPLVAVKSTNGDLPANKRPGTEKRTDVPQDASQGTTTEKAQPTRPRRAFFAIDENSRVVIRIVDSEGNVVRQIPPEEFLKAVEALKENMQHLLDREV